MRWTLLWWELQYCNSVVISFFKEMYWFFHHIIFLCFPTFVVYTTGFPMRPIVSFCGSPTYQLFKYLTTILQPLTDKSRLQSKEDFINATKTVQILDDYKLVSFDVKSLFTSIPLLLALKCTENAILQSTDPLPLPTEDIMDLLNLCLTSTYFQYNGKHYKQLHGTAMGSPVSVVVAEIVMQNIEESALSTCRQTIPLWLRRYVDVGLRTSPVKRNW